MNSSSDADVNSDGLSTTVLPAASAGASFHAVSSSGEFHGMIARDDAERLVARVVEDVGLVDRDDRAFDLVGEPAVVVIPLRHVGGLRAHLGVELAVVAHFDLGERLRFLGDQIAELAQQRAALRRGQLRPVARR